MRALLIAALLLAATGCGDGSDPATEPASAQEPKNTAPRPTPTPAATEPTTTVAPEPEPALAAVDICAYRDMGIWVDVYDTVPAFVEAETPPVSPDDVAVMQANGVRTLYLQVAKDDPRSPGIITDETSASEFLRRAHAAGIQVVAWYLPTHRDHALDVERALALVNFDVDGERFDGVALDIEGTEAVTDVAERNRLLLDLMKTVDEAAGAMPIGAIVYPPVVFDVLNDQLWPEFPWAELAPHVDVWLPMAYWTYRDMDSPYRDAYLYTSENIQRLRDHVGDPDAPVHIIGGIGDKATDTDYENFRRAATDKGAIGYSVYDYDTLSESAWPLLRGDETC